ncbi:helix-turn-helix domain-containing protein [Allosphingosinicella sp.]|jgi:AraC-like DNA-binding protein|uniref:AraC family transcriptional regulator n=1 Tax=Allosphingosinicella sp. TaxID=2823234 RepID=UPI002F198095
MTLEQLDAALRVGAIAIILLLAWLLFRGRRMVGMPALLFPPLAFCLSGFLIGKTPLDPVRLTGVPGAVAHSLSGFSVVFLWWFCLSCFESRFRLRGGVLAVGILWAVLAGMDRGLFGAAAAKMGLTYLLVGLGLGIVGHLVWRLWAERHGDLIERRRDARILVAVLLGGQLLIDLSADVLFGFAWRPPAFSMTQNLALLGFGLWLTGRVLAVRPEVLTFGAASAPALAAGPVGDEPGIADEALRRRLSVLIEQERVFLDPEISFADFVRRMDAPERLVRRLVNHELGFDHFRTFLNHYRLAEARRLLADPARQDDKLIAVALDSGFASLASFNRVFRASEGCTPSDYRGAARPGLPRSHASGKVRQKARVPGFEERSAVI